MADQTIEKKSKKVATRQSNRHAVREAVQGMILSGEFKPGSKLVQMDLARQFNVTQNVVREALLELQPSGLVEAHDNKGIFVGDLSVEKFLEYLDVRAAFEGLVASLCCERINRSDIRELRNVTEETRAASKEDRIGDAIKLDTVFHHRLLDISGNGVLQQITHAYSPLAKIVAPGSLPPATYEETYVEHMNILDALEQGKPQEAERFAKVHVYNSKRLFEQTGGDVVWN